MNGFDSFWRWTGRILIALVVWGIIAAVVNFLVMPMYTRMGTEVRVPYVKGMTLSEARSLYGRQGFKLVVDDERYDANHPPGTILAQWPNAGGWTKPGRRIHLAVSAGAPTAEVPDLIGVSRDDAVFKLQAAGLRLGEARYEFSTEQYEGLVLRQTPEAGEIVDKLTEASIVISMGPEPDEFEVPSVVNLPEQQARYLILKSGLNVGEVTYDNYVRRRDGVVVIQNPVAGTEAAPGDSVELVVNRR